MKPWLFLVISTLFLMNGCKTTTQHDPNLVRRYFDYPEFADDYNQYAYPFRQKEVIEDIKLTNEQIKEIQNIFNAGFYNTSEEKALEELKKLLEDQKENNLVNKEKLRGKIVELSNKAVSAKSSVIKGRVNRVLTKEQKKRLEEINLQTKGPAIVLFDKKIAMNLKLDRKTLMKMAETYDQTETALLPMREDLKKVILERKKEPDNNVQVEKQKEILTAMLQIIRKRDSELIQTMGADKYNALLSLYGEPINIKWVGVSCIELDKIP